jgi:hypothetical protein
MTESGGPQSRLKRAKQEASDVADIVAKARSGPGLGKYFLGVAVLVAAAAIAQGATVQKIGIGPLQIDFADKSPAPKPAPGPQPGPTTPVTASTPSPTPDPTDTPTSAPTTTVPAVVDAQGMVKVDYPTGTPDADAVVVKASAKKDGAEVVLTVEIDNNSAKPILLQASAMGFFEATDAKGTTAPKQYFDSRWTWANNPVQPHGTYTGNLLVSAPSTGDTLTLDFSMVNGMDSVIIPNVPVKS